MSNNDALAIDSASPPFDRYRNIRWLAPERRGQRPAATARHHLYSAREKHNPVSVLIKVTSKSGLVYERDLANEISSLSTINRALPDSRHFPGIHEHGRLDDGRVYLITSLFDEFPLATRVDAERVPDKLVAHLRTAIAIADALEEIHGLDIFHVDLNPMNVLYGTSGGDPVIRIIDFESSYERRRHATARTFSPPTTPGYSAPEIPRSTPDARADVFSLGVILYTLLAGYSWKPGVAVSALVTADSDLDAELKTAILTAIAPDRAQRFPSVSLFRVALERYLERIWPGRSR